MVVERSASGEFAGKVVMVTGAASGIGRAVAIAFAREGATLALCDQNAEGLAETVVQGCPDALTGVIDITDDAAVDGFVTSILARFGRLDCAANCAGIGATNDALADISIDAFDRMIAVNLKGVWLSMKRQIPAMIASGGGSIVNIASGAGLLGTPMAGAYVAAKHGVVGLTRAGALDYAARGIRVNAICPSFTRTPMAMSMIEEREGLDEALVNAVHPIGRMGEPHEQADAVLYLCSDRASYVTGTTLCVDGGYTAQ